MDHERINMKLCFKPQKSAKETYKMLKLVYGDAAVTMKMVYRWFKWFRNGCEFDEDKERWGRPSTSKTQQNVERVSEMIWLNRRLTIKEISEDLNISYSSIQNILTTDLNMRWVSAKFVPCILTVEQKQQHLSISLELCTRAASDSNFLVNVITGDETWVYGWSWDQGSEFSMEITQFSSCEKVHQSRSNIKVMIVFFWPWWNCAIWVCTQEHYSEL